MNEMNQPSPQRGNERERSGGKPFALTPFTSEELSARFGRPEAFRLPIRGGDPFFGLTRGWYYKAEKDGLLRLIRLRSRGKQRGVTLVPYDDVAAIIAAAKLG